MLFTFNLPRGRNQIELGPVPGAARGTPTMIRGNAQNQVTLDTSVYPIPMLLAAGFTLAILSGPTASRPTVTNPGMSYLDTELGYTITRDNANARWINASGATV
jgi:hypothetical protein